MCGVKYDKFQIQPTTKTRRMERSGEDSKSAGWQSISKWLCGLLFKHQLDKPQQVLASINTRVYDGFHSLRHLRMLQGQVTKRRREVEGL